MNGQINGLAESENIMVSNPIIKSQIEWLSEIEEKIVSWRLFRKEISALTIPKAISIVSYVWANCPKVQKSLFQIEDTATWPSPWELLSQKVFCQNSQSLGAFYTLGLSTLPIKELHLELYVQVLDTPAAIIRINNHSINFGHDNNSKLINSIDFKSCQNLIGK